MLKRRSPSEPPYPDAYRDRAFINGRAWLIIATGLPAGVRRSWRSRHSHEAVKGLSRRGLERHFFTTKMGVMLPSSFPRRKMQAETRALAFGSTQAVAQLSAVASACFQVEKRGSSVPRRELRLSTPMLCISTRRAPATVIAASNATVDLRSPPAPHCPLCS